MRVTDPDSFYPFDDAGRRSDGDFAIDNIASHLELNNLQKRLLLRWLQEIELKLWFSHEKDESNPRLDIAVFTDDTDGTGSFVADVNVLRLFNGAVDVFNQIGDALEIQALEELKVAIEAAITARKARIETGGEP